MADKRISVTLDIGADISKAKSAAEGLNKIFSTMGLSSSISKNLNNYINGLRNALTDLESKSSNPLQSLTDVKGIESAQRKVESYISKIKIALQDLSDRQGIDLQKAFPEYGEFVKQINQAKNAFSDATADINKNIKNQTEALSKEEKEATRLSNKLDDLNAKQGSKSAAKSKTQANYDAGKEKMNDLVAAAERAKAKLAETKAALDAFEEANKDKKAQSTGNIDKRYKSLYAEENDKKEAVAEAEAEYNAATQAVENHRIKLEQLSSAAQTAANNYEKHMASIKQTSEDLETSKTKIDNLKKSLEVLQNTSIPAEAFEDFKNKIIEITGDETLSKLTNTKEGLEQIFQAIAKAEGTQLEGIADAIAEAAGSVNLLKQNVEGVDAPIERTRNELQRLGETESDIAHLTSRLKYFFSLAGGFQLMRRAIRSAIETTKELDAAMTQTAVVSTKTVGEMWKTLPQYSQEAKKLGSSIVDIYKAQTLYVQQGLDMNSAMDLGIETIKMARVAGIDAAEATNSMTAALRGFNMELNETSAVRINDVYSKLAQNTASNVQEISTAMTKTAALANSANMSFENTAAFLATIIESTREGAETAGTALKTVIARFTEVKKLYSEGELLGTDEEGQEVDVNKISAALRTAGINMNDFFTGAKGLDEIFLELGSKWDSLSTVQQRYIATMAAGSRQQSRFLALMQNYNRTVELTEMAYNSAGSGQEQFEKTLDSLEAKIHKLKAAWDTFTMGIANSDFIKGVIDAGTKILDLLNKIIDKLSGGKGITKSILSLVTAVGIFKGGKSLFNMILGKAAPSLIKNSGLKQLGMQGGITLAAQMTTSFKKAFERGGEGKLFSKTAASPFTQWLRGTYGSYDTKDIEKINQVKNQLFQGHDISAVQQQAIMLDIKTGNIDQANAKLKELGLAEKATAEQTQLLSSATQKTGANLSNLATTAGILGGVFIGVGSALENAGGTLGKFGTIIKGAGIALVSFMGIIKILDVAIKTFSVSATASISSIPILGWIAAAISAIIGLISVISTLSESASERFERISASAEKVSNNVDEVKGKFEEAKDLIEKIGEQENVLDGVITGTEEWNTAVQNLNQSIYELLRIYPELAGAIKWVNNHLELNTQTEVYQAWLKSQQENLQNGIIATSSGEIAVKKADREKRIKEGKFYGQYDMGNIGDSYLRSFAWKDLGYESQLLKNGQLYTLALSQQIKSKRENFGKGIDIDTLLADNAENYEQLGKGFWKYVLPQIEAGAINDGKDLAAAFDIYYNSLSEEFKDSLNTKEYTFTPEDYKVAFGLEILDENEEIQERRNQFISNFLDYYQDAVSLENLIATQNLPNISSKFERSKYNTKDIFADAYLKNIINNFSKIYKEITDKEISDYIGKSENKEAYKKAQGIEKNEDIDQDLFKEYARTQISLGKIFTTEDQYTKDLEKYFSSLPNEITKEVAAKIISGNIKDLTIDEYKKIDNGELNFGEIDKFTNINISSIGEKYQEYFHGLDESLSSRVEDFSNTIGQIDNLSSNLINLGKNSDANKVLDLIEGLGDLSDEAKNLIASTDFSKADNIHNLASALEDLHISVGSSFVSDLIMAADAVYTYSEATVKSQIDALEGARSSYEKMLEGQRKFTAEEYAQFAQLEGFDRSQWIKSGSDEYTYLGKTNSILSSIESMVTKLVNEQPKQLQDRIDKANELGEQIKALDTKFLGANRTYGAKYLTFDVQDTKTGETTQVNATDFARAILSPEGMKFSDDQLQNFAEELEIDVGDATGEALLSKLQTYLADYGNIEGLKQQLGILLDEQSAIQLQSLSGAAILERDFEKDSTLNQYSTSNLLDTKLEIGDKENVEYLKEQLNLTEDYTNALKALTIDARENKKSFEALAKTYQDNADALTEEGKKTGIYGAALGKLTVAAKKAFNNNEHITEEFVEKNLEDFKAFSEGSEEAVDNIRKALKILVDKDFNQTEEGAKAVQAATAILDQADFSVNGTFDASQIEAGLFNTLKDAEKTKKYLDSIGWTAEIVGLGEEKIPGSGIYEQYSLVVQDTAKSTAKDIKSSGGGGGGGGSGKEFKNDFDKYYNMVEDINELERLRNLLETDYEQLLKSEAISGKAIYDNLKKQIQLLKERRDITADLAEKRKGQIFETMDDKQYASVRKYAWWNDTDQTIEIDWDAINKVKDSEQGDLIKEYVSKLEGFQSQYDEQIEALEDIETTLQEIQERGQEEYTSLEDRTRDALIKQIQDKIDELTAVDEAINDTNQKLMDSIQKELEKQRQERENAKTEEELADKEQRLAYLQQDSSGANALEIAKLQEELADARESYTDSLIDQKITELQEQNDEAAQQRQEQIDLMQQSLDWQEKSGAFWEQVYEYIQAGTDEVGTLVHGSELENLLKTGEAWDSLSEEGQMKWLEELENQVAQAIGYLSLSRQLEEIGTKEGTKITFTDAEGNTHTGTVDKNGNVVVKNADGSTTTWKDVYQSYDGSYQTLETQENAQTTPKPATNSGKPSNSSGNNSSNNGTPGNTPPPGKKYKIVHDTVWWSVEERNDGNYENETTALNEAKNHNDKVLKEYQDDIQRFNKILIEMDNGTIQYTDQQREELLRKIKSRQDLINYKNRKGYKTGGLADYTGPAWLDGTPSKPELVLNARDTENFIQLKDHLAALRQAGTLNTGGDNYYDIDVHVDSLGSDYDVDMAIDRIKTRLYQDGAYRNVNTLNRLR